VLYLLYIADLPVALGSTTYADDTAVLAAHNNHKKHHRDYRKVFITSRDGLKNGESKTTEQNRRETGPPITPNGQRIPQADDAKYLGLHLDRRLNWKKHIYPKRKQLGSQLGKMYRLFDSKSQLWTENKLLLYDAILKSIWA